MSGDLALVESLITACDVDDLQSKIVGIPESESDPFVSAVGVLADG